MDPSQLSKQLRARLPRAGSPLAVLAGALLVGFGVAIRFPLDRIAGEPLPPYITLYPMVVMAAFVGGIRVGLFAMGLSAVAAWILWLPPPFVGASPGRLATGLVFLGTGSLAAVTSGIARLLLDEVTHSEELRTRAARESVHRIKNLLAVVQSISRKISRSCDDVETYRDRLEQRLAALAVAQDLLLRQDGVDTELHDLIEAALGPFLPNPHFKLRLDGDASVPKYAVTPLSMALYELATNSAKYGALGNGRGDVLLSAHIENGRCRLRWDENHPADATPAERIGLGSSLIRAALASLSDSQVDYELRSDGVLCVFEWPLTAGRVTRPPAG